MTDQLRQAAQLALEALEGELLKMLDKPEDEQYRVRYAYLLTVITALRTALAAQPEWQGLTDGDWSNIQDRRNTSLDTFQQGVVWAADILKGRNK